MKFCIQLASEAMLLGKEGTISPTVSIVAMVLLCAIDASEARYGVVSDIPDALLHEDLEDNDLMLLYGTIS